MLLVGTDTFAVRSDDGHLIESVPVRERTRTLLNINMKPAGRQSDFDGKGRASHVRQDALPCLEVRDDGETDSAEQPTDLCMDEVGMRPSLATNFGHIRGEQARFSGNFDGLDILYRLDGGLTIKGFAGYPDLTTNKNFDPQRYFFGFNTGYRNTARTWELNGYYIDQHNGSSLSERMLGAAMHYSRPAYSLMVLLDFDLNNKTYTGVSTTGAWKLRQGTTLSATMDIRHLPMHKRQRTYLQQTMSAADGWAWVLPDDRVEQLAKKYTNTVMGVALSLFHKFSRHLQINGSYSVLSTSPLRSECDLCDGFSSINEYFYRFKLSAIDWMTPGDKNKLDIKHKITGSVRKTSAAIDALYPLTRFWNIQPKIHTERSNDVVNNSVSTTTSTTLMMTYKTGQDAGLQLHAGGKWRRERVANQQDDSFSYYVSLDYRKTF